MAFGSYYTAGETPALPGHRACRKLLILAKSVLLGRRPSGRLLPSATRRSAAPMSSKLAADAFEFFDEVGDFGEDAVFFGEVLRVEGAHFREYGVEFGAVVAGKFAFE